MGNEKRISLFRQAKGEFGKKHSELELRRERLNESIRLNREEFNGLLRQKSVAAKSKAKKLSKKISFAVKYGYVYGGHVKNEILGMLTLYNAGRSFAVKTQRHIRYDPSDPKLYLNMYFPRRAAVNGKNRLFVYIHGGGWIGGWPEAREAFTTRIAAAGYAVASLYYGTAPAYAHPKMIQNIYKAFAFLKENAERYNIDADKIFVGGESAGAHLAAMAGCISSNPEYGSRFELDALSRDIKIAGLVLNCGVYDMERALGTGFRNVGVYTQAYCGGVAVEDLSCDKKKEISPIYWVNKDFPSSFVISAENDKLAVLSFDFVAKLFQTGIYVEHFHATGKAAVHAFAVSQALRISREAMKEIKAFLKKISRDPVGNKKSALNKTAV